MTPKVGPFWKFLRNLQIKRHRHYPRWEREKRFSVLAAPKVNWCQEVLIQKMLDSCLEDTFSPETISTARNLQPRHFQPPDTFSHDSERHFQPWDTFSWDNFSPETLAAPRNFQLEETFSREKLSALGVKDTFSPETLSVSTISALRHLRPRETFSLEKLSASRNFQPRTVWRHFQPQDSCSPKQFGDIFSPEKISTTNSWETLSAPRRFQPRETFSLKICTSSINFHFYSPKFNPGA